MVILLISPNKWIFNCIQDVRFEKKQDLMFNRFLKKRLKLKILDKGQSWGLASAGPLLTHIGSGGKSENIPIENRFSEEVISLKYILSISKYPVLKTEITTSILFFLP